MPVRADFFRSILIQLAHLHGRTPTHLPIHTDGGKRDDRLCKTEMETSEWTEGDVEREDRLRGIKTDKVCYCDGWLNEITCWFIDSLTGFLAGCLVTN